MVAGAGYVQELRRKKSKESGDAAPPAASHELKQAKLALKAAKDAVQRAKHELADSVMLATRLKGAAAEGKATDQEVKAAEDKIQQVGCLNGSAHGLVVSTSWSMSKLHEIKGGPAMGVQRMQGNKLSS